MEVGRGRKIKMFFESSLLLFSFPFALSSPLSLREGEKMVENFFIFFESMAISREIE